MTPEHRADHRRVWAITGPAILANSSAPLVGLVDTWAIGHLPGAVHLAAVGLGSVIFNYLLWAFGFLRMGTTGVVAQAFGRNDEQATRTITCRSLGMGLVLGLALLVAQEFLLWLSLKAMAPPEDVAAVTSTYFRIRIWSAPAALMIYALAGVLFGLARTREVLVQQLVLNLSNAALNLLFVVGMGMGVAGVALGTLLAQWLAVVVSLWLVARLLGGRALLSTLAEAATWRWKAFVELVAINGYLFVRTILLMTALALVMRVAAQLGDVEMAASHVVTQYMMLMALGLDGFAHAAEAMTGAAWGDRNLRRFRYWVRITALWAVAAAVLYALFFALAGEAITAALTDITPVREVVKNLMPMVVALPLVAVACYQFDGVYIGATAAKAMMVTMAIAFVVYLLVLGPMTSRWGLPGLWAAVLVFMGARGLAQWLWYPRLVARLE